MSDIKRPEDFVHNYRNTQRNYSHYLKRKRKDIGDCDSKELVFVIRIKGSKNLSENQKKLFNLLKLKKIHEARLFRLTPEIKKILTSLENQITFGKINQNTFQNLILKRGYVRNGKQIVAINSNQKIEDVLGELGIVCVEDLVAEMYLTMQNFEEINKKLCTFKLNKPNEGYGNKLAPASKGGVWGENKSLEDLVKKMI